MKYLISLFLLSLFCSVGWAEDVAGSTITVGQEYYGRMSAETVPYPMTVHFPHRIRVGSDEEVPSGYVQEASADGRVYWVPPPEPKIEWLGRISYTEVYDPPLPPPDWCGNCKDAKFNMTFKEEVEIGLREDGVVVYRKK